ncbi:hypothetical protein DPMN_191434 [Dreissena polymorpha]|uniref:Uncharacterized protein n=1 Tax=Dreissena polymorpha TaxID=45954 RepID=A0A9D4BDB0_DREPO|nr:hypothetical protein DPMN_191434 [Dreissena polymorpha]
MADSSANVSRLKQIHELVSEARSASGTCKSRPDESQPQKICLETSPKNRQWIVKCPKLDSGFNSSSGEGRIGRGVGGGSVEDWLDGVVAEMQTRTSRGGPIKIMEVSQDGGTQYAQRAEETVLGYFLNDAIRHALELEALNLAERAKSDGYVAAVAIDTDTPMKQIDEIKKRWLI